MASSSCNRHRFSLFGNGEMNAAVWHAATARALLSALLGEHLDRDLSGMDDRAALQLFGRIARENRARFAAGDPAWQGLAFTLGLAAIGNRHHCKQRAQQLSAYL